jgi:outer membrane lipase/esterase
MLSGVVVSALWRARFLVCALLLGAAACPAQAAAPYSQLFVFGDSLSDSGNALVATSNIPFTSSIPGPPYFNGRFSNGFNFADRLNQRLFNQPLLPSLAGGTDYAVGGATTGTANIAVPQVPSGILVQRDLFLQTLGSASADSKALYVVYGGSNDIIGAVEQFKQDPSNGVAIRNQVVSQAVGHLSDIITDLADKGARHFLIPNLPDVGRVPRFTNDPTDSSFASAVSVDFNAALDHMLAGFSNLDIHRLDVYDAFNAARQGVFGFSNTTGACYTGPLTGGPPEHCPNPDAFLFWDDLHPSARTHAILGDLAYAAAVPEPQVWVLLFAGMALAGWNVLERRALRQRGEGSEVSVGLRSSRISSMRI